MNSFFWTTVFHYETIVWKQGKTVRCCLPSSLPAANHPGSFSTGFLCGVQRLLAHECILDFGILNNKLAGARIAAGSDAPPGRAVD